MVCLKGPCWMKVCLRLEADIPRLSLMFCYFHNRSLAMQCIQ